MPSLKKENLSSPISPRAVIKGTLIAVATSLFLSMGAGIVYHTMSVSEQSLPWSAAVILAVSVFGGSLAAGREAGGKGLYHGLMVGLLFFLTMWLLAGLLTPGMMILGLLYKLLILTTAGMLGGIVGVGLS